VDHVDPVSEKVGDLPTAEIEIGAKVEVLLGVVVAPLHGAEKAGPVKV
jgi:hypothetical protein